MPKRTAEEDDYEEEGGRALERLHQFEASRLPQESPEEGDEAESYEPCPVCGVRHAPDNPPAELHRD